MVGRRIDYRMVWVDAQLAEMERVRRWAVAGGRPFISGKEKLSLQARSGVAWQGRNYLIAGGKKGPQDHENQVQESDTSKRSFNEPIRVQKELLFSAKRQGRSFCLGKNNPNPDIYIILDCPLPSLRLNLNDSSSFLLRCVFCQCCCSCHFDNSLLSHYE